MIAELGVDLVGPDFSPNNYSQVRGVRALTQNLANLWVIIRTKVMA